MHSEKRWAGYAFLKNAKNIEREYETFFIY